MTKLIPNTTPLREFKGHKEYIMAVAVFPDLKRRMVTGSQDHTLHLWGLKTGVILKEMRGHSSMVRRLAVSRDGQMIASGDYDGKVIAWHGETGESLTQPIKAYSNRISSLDFSPDGTVLACSGSDDKMMKLWNTETWKLKGNPIKCGDDIKCVRYSPSGKLLAIATSTNVEIYTSGTRECVTSFKGHTSYNLSLAWTPDGTRLLTGGNNLDPTMREWDTLTWQQVGVPWTGHTRRITALAVNPVGTLVASASYDNQVRLWRLSDRRTVAIFQHSSSTECVTFSADGKHILSGGQDKTIRKWAVPKDMNSKILAITIARDACITGNLSNAEELLTQEIDADANNYISYAHRSFVVARKHDWDHALQDAIKSISIQPSLTGYISKGIALGGKGHVRNMRTSFDVAFMYTNRDSQTIHLLLLVKVCYICLASFLLYSVFQAIALFNADQRDEAMLLVEELAAGCSNADTRACHIVEAYLRVQLGIKALDGAHYDEAADHFTAAVNPSAFSSRSPIHYMYEDLVALFGWDLESLWLTVHQKRCQAFLSAGKLDEALKSHKYMMDNIDETTKASCNDWSNDFMEKCSALCVDNGGAALAASDYDRAIDLCSMVIDLTSPSDAVFANRSKAKLGKRLWMEALLDAQKVIQLNPLSHVGYKLEHAAFHGAQRYDEAIQAFQIMLSKLDNAPDTETRKLCQQYLSPSEADRAIRKVIDARLDNAPLRVLDTITGLLCDRKTQICTFKTSKEYMELMSSIITHPVLQMKRIQEVVMTYFQYAMLSHRWEGKEPLLQDIEGKVVYELDPVGGIAKLQSFCKTARDAGYRWAWSDTCCINKKDNVEVQESINSMFVWYLHSALTIIYLSDVPPSSKSGALAKSEWNRRGWTFQEFVAPKVVLFYQKDWTLYLNDQSPNHKESAAIMEELENVTGIDRRAVVAFRPGTRGAREKLQWASMRVTTVQEDIAYSLFGIFNITLPVIYGEKKQRALGRLLQEIIAQSGDITALDWAGESSEFNSCLPADITSYQNPPSKLSSLSEDEIQSSVSSLRGVVALESGLELYQTLDSLSAPRFAQRRLHLPCIVFPVTEARRMPGQDEDTYMYELESDGLRDLQITAENNFTPFSLTRPPPAWQTILLVRPWSRHLLGLHDPADDAQSVKDRSVPKSGSHDSPPAQNEPVYSESHLRALRLIARLGQPFGAFLLARQRNGAFKRIASGHDIVAQVKDMASISDIMNIRTLEVL